MYDIVLELLEVDEVRKLPKNAGGNDVLLKNAVLVKTLNEYGWRDKIFPVNPVSIVVWSGARMSPPIRMSMPITSPRLCLFLDHETCMQEWRIRIVGSV